MRRATAFVLGMALAGAAWADSISVGTRVISDGDAVGIVFEVLGKPDRTVQLENKFGAGLAERWEYYRDGKTISIVIADSKVVSITEIRD